MSVTSRFVALAFPISSRRSSSCCASARSPGARGRRREPIELDQVAGAHAELLLRAVQPLRRSDRAQAVADGIAAMSREEASYWHAKAQRPRRAARAADPAHRSAPVSRSLIEQWFPAATVGAESLRERGASSALPPINFLHVWWARRPLTASRAAVVASLLPRGRLTTRSHATSAPPFALRSRGGVRRRDELPRRGS